MYCHIIILLSFVFYLYGNIGRVALGIPNGALLGLLIGYSSFIIAMYKQIWTRIERQALWIIAGAVLLLVLRYVADAEDKLIRNVSILVLPALLISVFPTGQVPSRSALDVRLMTARFLLCFYVVECGTAILEFIMKDHVFGWFEYTYTKGIRTYAGDGNFRSVALMGGPLENALGVTVMMLFYLFSQRLPVKKKLLLWLLGLVAVFCFNARAAIVVNLLSMVLYIATEIFKRRSDTNLKYIVVLLAVCSAVGILYLYGLGERLWETGNIGKDASIETRLKLFRYMAGRDWADYLWGSSLTQLRHEMATSIKVKIIENFWLSYVFRIGLIATAYFTVLYFCMCRSLLRTYPMSDKIVISAMFIILAFSNNSLDSNFVPLFIFMLCSYTYRPVLLGIEDVYLFIRRNKNKFE